MLTLKRRNGESIYLRFPDGRISEVKIIKAQGSRAVVGLDFPGDVEIQRNLSEFAADPRADLAPAPDQCQHAQPLCG